MDMGVVGQRSGPGVQNTHDGNLASHVPWVLGEFHEGMCRSGHQDAVEFLRMASEERAEIMGDREHEMKVIDRQKLGLSMS